jgi:hypothetical protein
MSWAPKVAQFTCLPFDSITMALANNTVSYLLQILFFPMTKQ